MIKFGQDEGVKIDQAHADLITGLIKSHKPKTVLELGIGGGQSTNAILAGLDYNQQTFDYTLVDNWMDFGGVMPGEVNDLYGKRINIVTSDEKAFVFGNNKKYDFIMSDADHHQTDQWFEYVLDSLVADGGILCYHDVNLIENEFVNLRNIYYRCQEFNLKHVLFNKNSLPGERCQRGLLVIFK
jgi:predicted O-methyltransferase YrrM